MKKDLIFENHFEVYQLTHASPDTVFEWLREQKPNFRIFGGAHRDIADVLIKRDEPVINLGLALYATLFDDDAMNLFRNSDKTIKQAVLAGPSVGRGLLVRWIDKDSEILRGLLQSFDDNLEMLVFLLSNESIDHCLLTLLYDRQEPFDELTDEQWFNAVDCSSSNQSLCPSSYRNRRKLYEFDWITPFDSTFKAAWKLFEILPVNAQSARVLSQFGDLLAPYGEVDIPQAPDDMNIPALIKRWDVDESVYEEYEITYFRSCRFALRSLLQDNSKIPGRITPDAIRKAYEEDKEGFLNAALASDYPYTREDLRDELRECCWEYQRDSNDELGQYTGYFDSKCEALQQKHPEWFLDSDGLYEMTLDDINDVGLRTEKRLERLEGEMKSISQSISQKMRELIEEHTSSALSQIYKAILWVMVIIIIGLIAILIKLY